MLQAQVTLVQALEIPHFLPHFKRLQLQLRNFKVFIVARSRLLTRMLAAMTLSL